MVSIKEEIKKIELTADVERVLSSAFLDDAEFIKGEIKSCTAELLQVDRAYCVVRLETYKNDKELVIVALAGSNIKRASTILFNAAKKIGCTSMRYHTKRPGLTRMLSHLEPNYVETVYKINI